MTYTTLMAHLELGQSNAGLLQVVGELVQRFHASEIGIAARPPLQVVYGEGYAFGELLEQDHQEAETLIKATEVEFRAALPARAPNLAWRSTSLSDSVSGYLAREARSADLIVAGAYGHSRLREWALGGVTQDLLRRANCCSLVSH